MVFGSIKDSKNSHVRGEFYLFYKVKIWFIVFFCKKIKRALELGLVMPKVLGAIVENSNTLLQDDITIGLVGGDIAHIKSAMNRVDTPK